MTSILSLPARDLDHVVRHIPRDIRDLLKAHPRRLWLGGGFLRAVISGEAPSDLDLFGTTIDLLRGAALILQARRGPGCRLHTTKNAITILTHDRLPVQFITRWIFTTAHDVIGSFDFTIAQAVIYCNPNGDWSGLCSASFYLDLAARRLVYTSPIRDEEAGGSLLRVLKFVRRGYVIQAPDLAAVCARLVGKIDPSRHDFTDQPKTTRLLQALLREVDPLTIIDGLEPIDDHGPVLDLPI